MHNENVIQVRYGRWLIGALVIAITSYFLSLVWVQRSLEREPVKLQHDVTVTEVTVEVKSYRARPRAKTLDCLENGLKSQISCSRSVSSRVEGGAYPPSPKWQWPYDLRGTWVYLFSEEICRPGGEFAFLSEEDL